MGPPCVGAISPACLPVCLAGWLAHCCGAAGCRLQQVSMLHSENSFPFGPSTAWRGPPRSAAFLSVPWLKPTSLGNTILSQPGCAVRPPLPQWPASGEGQFEPAPPSQLRQCCWRDPGRLFPRTQPRGPTPSSAFPGLGRLRRTGDPWRPARGAQGCCEGLGAAGSLWWDGGQQSQASRGAREGQGSSSGHLDTRGVPVP